MTEPTLAPAAALRRIAFLLERGREPTYKVRAFRRAAAAVDETDPATLARLAAAPGPGLRSLPGIGEVTERVIREAMAGEVPVYLRRLEAIEGQPVADGAAALRSALRGDCHSHSTWSDGGSPIGEMAEAARDLGHDYLVLTDHSPRLTVANGLSPERLVAQLDEVARVNEALAGTALRSGKPFRVLTGIEVDILEDGRLDQTDELLGRLESEFDPEAVFAACAASGVAVEVNSRPERQDPPKRLLRLAVEAGCLVSIDTDAHAPGQLDWQLGGCERAFACGVTPDLVVNTRDAVGLLAWAGRHQGERARG
jgi:putative hydrolase